MEDRSSDDEKVVPFHRVKTIQVVAEVGGPIDEVNATRALYSEEMEPEEVSLGHPCRRRTGAGSAP